jgi:hypothetical protein
MARIEPTREQFEAVLHDARIPLDLDTALQHPALRILLTNGAEALAERQADSFSRTLRRHVGRTDWRARAANDN